MTTDDKETADKFRRFFTSVFTAKDDPIANSEPCGFNGGLDTITITKDDVFELLNNVNTTK